MPRRHRTVRFPPGRRSTFGSRRELSSATAQVEQRFEATTVADLFQGNDVLIPAGLDDARRRQLRRQGDAHGAQGQPDRRVRPVDGQRPRLSDARHRHAGARERGHQGRGGARSAPAPASARSSAASSAASKGALLGVLIGGGGTVAATEGKDVTLPAGTILRVQARYTARDPIALTPTSSQPPVSAPMLMTGSWALGPASAFLEHGPRRLDRLLDVALGVGARQEPRLELRRRHDRCRAPASP